MHALYILRKQLSAHIFDHIKKKTHLNLLFLLCLVLEVDFLFFFILSETWF